MSGRLYLDVHCKSRMLYCLSGGDDLFVLCHYRGNKITNKEQEKRAAKEAQVAAALFAKKEEARRKAEENGGENGGGDGDVDGEEEEPEQNHDPVLKPTGPPLQFHRYSCGDLLCELYPAIAACCPDGTTLNARQERQTNSKRLFVMSTPEQRKNELFFC